MLRADLHHSVATEALAVKHDRVILDVYAPGPTVDQIGEALGVSGCAAGR
jgi:hypothetical protein